MKVFLFYKSYFILAAVLFATEIGIACCIHDTFFRPHFGDFLVIILIYCSIKSILNLSAVKAANFSLLICYCIEVAQGLNLLQAIGLHKYNATVIMLGKVFSWSDMLAYTCGFLLIIGVEKFYLKQKQSTTLQK
jgi:hypothetical protein